MESADDRDDGIKANELSVEDVKHCLRESEGPVTVAEPGVIGFRGRKAGKRTDAQNNAAAGSASLKGL